MLSVFLVDDEPLIRRGLKKLIPWEQNGFIISGEAGNGEDALDLITADNTDILITDIKMPIIDGLELSANIKLCYPGIKIIILTGFDDFYLLQQSIRNGVVDYLLKPVNAGLLVESLLKMKNQIETERYSYPYTLESQIMVELETQNKNGLLKVVDNLFNEFQNYKVPFEVICKICESIVASVDRYLGRGGSNLNDIMRKEVLTDNYFSKYSIRAEIKDELSKLLCSVIDHKLGCGNKKVIEEIKDYIEKHLHEEISLDRIAAKFFLNSSYISQLFKKETGENYVNFLMRLKIEKAKKLLKDPNLKIQDISEMVCYNDAKYFGQLFKKYVGMLPSEYRANIKN